MQFYDIVITDMSRPFMWPSSGLCSHHVSGRNVSVHLLVFIKKNIHLINARNMERIKVNTHMLHLMSLMCRKF